MAKLWYRTKKQTQYNKDKKIHIHRKHQRKKYNKRQIELEHGR